MLQEYPLVAVSIYKSEWKEALRATAHKYNVVTKDLRPPHTVSLWNSLPSEVLYFIKIDWTVNNLSFESAPCWILISHSWRVKIKSIFFRKAPWKIFGIPLNVFPKCDSVSLISHTQFFQWNWRQHFQS